MNFKGIVNPKKKIVTFTHPLLNPYAFIYSMEHKIYFEEYLGLNNIEPHWLYKKKSAIQKKYSTQELNETK